MGASASLRPDGGAAVNFKIRAALHGKACGSKPENEGKAPRRRSP